MYAASVPVCQRYLAQLAGFLATAETTRGPAALAGARLAPDMLPLETQVHVTANFALRACFPLCGKEVPPFGDFPRTFDGLRANIAYVTDLLGALRPADFAGAQERIVRDGAGKALVALPAVEFLHQYAMPNFFFHLTTAYAILRSQGVPLGKAHFDGFHEY
ncbi:MAG: hypothetical protein K0R43_947 [Pseudoduganella sp.]|jgi:hypothetical protein|nr:hypothetical protein [Pseudoduganella sp.]